MADIAKLDAALAHIEAHPEEWRQQTYGSRSPSCGTVGCLAYHVAVLDGAEISWSPWHYTGLETVAAIGGMPPRDYGAWSLGLSLGQADELFGENDTLDMLKAMRDALAADPDIHLSDLAAAAHAMDREVSPWT